MIIMGIISGDWFSRSRKRNRNGPRNSDHFSGDSNLTTPVRQIRNRCPNKRLIIAFPPTRRSAELKKAAHGHFVIGADKLRQNILPNEITTPSGYVLERP